MAQGKTEIGDAYVFPLEDGRYAACRILAGDGNNVLAACSSWVGMGTPNIENIELREILLLTHHSHSGTPLVMWVPNRIPRDFVSIGQIQPSEEDSRIESRSFGYWDSITSQPLVQWQWENDRKAVDKHDEIEQSRHEKLARKAAEKRTLFLQQLTLESLKNEIPLPGWSGHVDTTTVRRGRKIIRETVSRLIEMGNDVSKLDKTRALKDCMQRLVDLGVQYIDTESRHEVFGDIEAMAHACGIPEETEKIYACRNW